MNHPYCYFLCNVTRSSGTLVIFFLKETLGKFFLCHLCHRLNMAHKKSNIFFTKTQKNSQANKILPFGSTGNECLQEQREEGTYFPVVCLQECSVTIKKFRFRELPAHCACQKSCKYSKLLLFSCARTSKL